MSCKFSKVLARNFNSRPSARGDHSLSPSSRAPCHFNSRPSARGDAAVISSAFPLCISIHAPPRGATPSSSTYSVDRIFQFTPLREGRRLILSAIISVNIFQFTPLREGRRNPALELFRLRLFQFTPLREGRPQKICNFCKSFVQPLQISMA